ncbi:hypothetical protein ISS05_02240 [Candidatus Woesearchaeota archaeon]|nr:hypothetical protein [Candidatus Woesearchaeota archaeon]
MKKLIFGIIFLMIVVPMVHATTNKLLVDKLDVKVGDRWSRSVDPGETISREAEPGDEVDFKIKFKNNFTDAENLKIEDIVVTVTIEGIDDGEDLDEESKEFNINENDDKTITVSFKVPVEVDEDTYDVTIEAEGEDENGTNHLVEYRVALEVQKEENELRFYRQTLSPVEVKAGGTTSLTLGILNTGTENQEDVELIISNTDLEYSNVVTISEITEDVYEDDSRYLKQFNILIPKTVESGIYPLNIKVTYDNGDKVLEDIIDLTVVKAEEEKEPVIIDQEKEEEPVVVIKPTPTTPIITQPTITRPITVTEEESFFESKWFILALFGAELIIIVIAVLLVMALVRRKPAM